MNNNVKIAKQLIKLAKELIAVPTDTYENFENFSQDYLNRYHKKDDSEADRQLKKQYLKKMFDLFETEEEVDEFLKNKSKTFPNLREIISDQTIDRLLNDDWFVIISAGRNEKEIELYDNANEEEKEEMDKLLDERYKKLREFLQKFNVPYYQVIGQYGTSAELSYIVDLSNNGKNDENVIKSFLREIRAFCKNIKQDAIIEGLGRKSVWVFTNDQSTSYLNKTQSLNPEDSFGRSIVFTDKKDRRKNRAWADDFDCGNEQHDDWI